MPSLSWRRSHFLTVAGETPTAPAMERGVSPAWRRPTIKARMFGVVLAFL